MGVLPKLFKLRPWVDLDLFYAKVKFGHIGFCMGKSENYLFFGNYCSLGSQSCWKHLAKWVNEVEWVSKVKVVLWPWSKVTQISKLNFWVWPIYSGERFRASWPSCFLFLLKNIWNLVRSGRVYWITCWTINPSSSLDFWLTCRYRGHIHNSGPPSRQLACCTHGRSHTRSPGVSIMRVGSLDMVPSTYDTCTG